MTQRAYFLHDDTTAQHPDEPTNAARVRRTHEAVKAYRRARGMTRRDVAEGWDLGDMLADLMHWADAKGYEFDIALDRARANYEQERA